MVKVWMTRESFSNRKLKPMFLNKAKNGKTSDIIEARLEDNIDKEELHLLEKYNILPYDEAQQIVSWYEAGSRKSISSFQRYLIWHKYGCHCAYCGKEISLKEMQIDHLVSKDNGGLDEPSNYMPSCRDCNLFKASWSLEKFRESIVHDAYRIAKNRKKPCNWLSDRIARAYKFDENVKFYFEKEKEN